MSEAKQRRILFICSGQAGMARLAAAWCAQFSGDFLKPVCAVMGSGGPSAEIEAILEAAGADVVAPQSQLFEPGLLPGNDCVVLLEDAVAIDIGELPEMSRLERWNLDPKESLNGLCMQLRRRVSDLVRDFAPCHSHVEIPVFSDAGDYRVEVKEELHKGFASVERLHFRHRLYTGGWSTPVQREVLGRGPAAAVLMYDPEREELVFIEQFRIAAANDPNGPWQLEMVAGIVDPGETPQGVVVREAIEEAGCEVRDLELISRYLPSMGMSTESMFVFVGRVDASSAGGVHGLVDEGEDILVRVLGVNEAAQMMADGRISNAATIIAMQWFALNHTALRSRWIGN